MSLTEYKRKRHFNKTIEPSGKSSDEASHIFVIQKHFASHLHFDFRLEINGVLKSWAVPKGPSEKVNEKRLAVEVEDHPVNYASFEGIIPRGEYGAGKVEIWDHGIWKTQGDPQKQLKKGHLEVELYGQRLSGKWMLIRTKMAAKKANWLLIKHAAVSAPSTVPSTVPIVPSMPEFIEPQLCTLKFETPTASDWIHEIKLDGYRTLCRKEDNQIKMLTRSGLDWSKKYNDLVKQCKKIKEKSFMLDGEIVYLDGAGISHFSSLQKALKKNNSVEMVYCVFDLLFLNGKDLRNLPLLQRKLLLQQLLKKSDLQKIIFHPHQEVHGPSMHHSACQLGLEGTVSKKLGDSYTSGRTSSWIKVKCLLQKDFVICGYTDQKNGSTLGALILGDTDDQGNLYYVGRVGTGFNQRNLPMLTKKLKANGVKKSVLLTEVPQDKNIHWLKPVLTAAVEFTTWTEDRKLRHAVFKKLILSKAKLSTSFSHPQKVIFPKEQISKLDLANYYRFVEKQILPHIKNRPLSLLRCPDGQGENCFFQKHLDKTDSIITIQNLSELLNLIQLNALELHSWNCQANNLENPDLIVFDLDPDAAVDWKATKQAAFELKDLLQQLGLKCFLKVSGKKGLHLHVPILPKYGWDEVKNFSKSVCLQMVNSRPDLYTINIMKKNRKKKIFLDYLRNGYGATAITAFSVRNHPFATLALPIHWDQLRLLKGPDVFTLKKWTKTKKKVPPKGKDPWADYFKLKQTISVLDEARKNGDSDAT